MSMRRDGLNREAAITTHHAGQFSGELSQLSGRETLAQGMAGAEGCTALPFDAAHVRALIIGSAEIGEVLMRAFILRRMGLLRPAKKVALARCWSAFRAPRSSRGSRAFSAATVIPTRCSMLPRTLEAKAVVERVGVLPTKNCR